MPDAAIQLISVSKFFGKYRALNKVNLEVAQGERVVVCGPSGSGKSTLIRCINRLEEHSAGRIFVEGTELTDDLKALDEVRREVGMVFQDLNLFNFKLKQRKLQLHHYSVFLYYTLELQNLYHFSTTKYVTSQQCHCSHRNQNYMSVE